MYEKGAEGGLSEKKKQGGEGGSSAVDALKSRNVRKN